VATNPPISPGGRVAKRTFDVVLAGCGLVVALPVFLVVPILIKMTSPGPVFYGARRVGLRGQQFQMWKFRTMRPDASASSALITGGEDPRITRIGAYLRKLKIDELPQLLNVLNGTMSIVGPRPQSPKYVEHYDESALRTLSVKPGLTGPAMIVSQETLLSSQSPQDNESYYLEHLLPERITRDLYYVDHWSFGLDVTCVVRTAQALLSRDRSVRQKSIVDLGS